jgi:hypothetical protein
MKRKNKDSAEFRDHTLIEYRSTSLSSTEALKGARTKEEEEKTLRLSSHHIPSNDLEKSRFPSKASAKERVNSVHTRTPPMHVAS